MFKAQENVLEEAEVKAGKAQKARKEENRFLGNEEKAKEIRKLFMMK